MPCEHECYEVGGKWIAENPQCPIHNYKAMRDREDQRDRLEDLYKTLEALVRCVEHYGANKTEKGEPHPQQQLLDEAKRRLDHRIELG